MADTVQVTVRFLLNLPTEEPTTVDVMFEDDRQAKKAIAAILAGQGQLVQFQAETSVPVLLRADSVAAAFVLSNSEEETEETEAETEAKVEE